MAPRPRVEQKRAIFYLFIYFMFLARLRAETGPPLRTELCCAIELTRAARRRKFKSVPKSGPRGRGRVSSMGCVPIRKEHGQHRRRAGAGAVGRGNPESTPLWQRPPSSVTRALISRHGDPSSGGGGLCSAPHWTAALLILHETTQHRHRLHT